MDTQKKVRRCWFGFGQKGLTFGVGDFGGCLNGKKAKFGKGERV
jgi:hypothetical protein